MILLFRDDKHLERQMKFVASTKADFLIKMLW